MAFEYLRPESLDEALRLVESREDVRFIAGGTDLMAQVRKRKAPRPGALVSLRSIPELHGIRESRRGLRIGATTTLADALEHPGLQQGFPALVDAARAMGSAQIRSVATLGGNLCNASPAADLAPPLLVYDARVELQSLRGTRELTLDELFRGPGQTCLEPGEVLAAVLLDHPPPGSRAIFLRKGRVRMDLALVSLALRVDMDGARCRTASVAAGAVAPTPIRLRGVEELIEGRELGDELIGRAQEEADAGILPISDLRASAEYRRQILKVYLRRALEQIRGRAYTESP